MMVSKHFSRAELQCKGTGLYSVANGFLAELEALREAYGHPMIVTSCCRAVSHNTAVGGHPRSLHLIDNPYWNTDTCAIDIKRPDARKLHKLISCALRLGWSVGFAKTFIHLDRRSQFTGLAPAFFDY